MSAGRWCSLLLALLLPVVAGCRAECDPSKDEGVCEGGVARNCPRPGADQLLGVRWSSENCVEQAQVCVKPDGSFNAFCAFSSEPSPLCAEAAPEACEGAQSLVYCHQGFIVGRSDCRSCEAADAGPTCLGGFGSACTRDEDCAASRECKTNPSCEACTERRCYLR